MAKKSTTMTKSSGNVFIDLGFRPEEATILAMRADLMGRLRLLIEKKGWTQAKRLRRRARYTFLGHPSPKTPALGGGYACGGPSRPASVTTRHFAACHDCHK